MLYVVYISASDMAFCGNGIVEGDEESDFCILLYCVVLCYILLYITASDMAFCGNGIVKGDEECDCCILLYCDV